MNITRYFQVRFAKRSYSISQLLSFTQDHIQRLAAANSDGHLDAMLAATAGIYESFGGTHQERKTSEAIQKARTETKLLSRDRIHQEVSRAEGLLHAKLGRQSANYLEFFPQGLSELRRAPESEVAVILERLTCAAKKHQPELEPAFSELRDKWRKHYEAASKGRAATKGATGERTGAREELQLQLTRNLLALGSLYLDQPEKAKEFFDMARLGDAFERRRTKKAKAAGNGTDGGAGTADQGLAASESAAFSNGSRLNSPVATPDTGTTMLEA